MITRSYPPFSGGGVQRMVKFAKYLQEFNWEALVICPNPGAGSWIDNTRLEEIKRIEEIRIGQKKVDRTLYEKISQKLFPIDPNFGWASKVLSYLKQLDLAQFDVVFTSGPPHSIHYVGFKLSKLKNDIKWVADFRDPYTLGPEYKAISFLHQRYDRWFERKIYETADHILTNTEINRIESIKGFSDRFSSKITTIYNGYDKDDLIVNERDLKWVREKFHYTYLGGLRGDKVDGFFYKTIKKAIEINPKIESEIVIHLVGDISRKGSMMKDLSVDHLFDEIGEISYNDVGIYLKSSHGCLTWQRDRARYAGTIAGKVFDYIGMEKPIFSLGQDNGEIFNLLTSYNIGVSESPENITKCAEAFIKFHEGIKRNLFSYQRFFQKFGDSFSRPKQAKQLASIFNKLVISL